MRIVLVMLLLALAQGQTPQQKTAAPSPKYGPQPAAEKPPMMSPVTATPGEAGGKCPNQHTIKVTAQDGAVWCLLP